MSLRIWVLISVQLWVRNPTCLITTWYFFSPTGCVLVCVHLEYGCCVSACTASSTVHSISQLLLKKYDTNMITTAIKKTNKQKQQQKIPTQMPNTYWESNWKKKKSKDLFIIVYLLMFSCALKIINKHHVFCSALILCGLFNYSALLVTLPQNISIILQVWTRLCILPCQPWD